MPNTLSDAGVSRREFLSVAGAAGAVMFLAGGGTTGSPAVGSPTTKVLTSAGRSPLMGFEPVPASTLDRVIVPKGYRARVLISWGDPVFPDAPAFSQGADASAQARQFGDNNDGMTFFPIDDERAVLAVNHEFTNYPYLFSRGEAMTLAEVRKAQAAHGVTIVELKKEGGRWRIDVDGKRNRRITANTPVEATGPAAGHPLMHTGADGTGRHILGTLANCANGVTPWGTYLTCEENFNYYFVSGDGSKLKEGPPSQHYRRYGISERDKKGYRWYRFEERFDVAKTPNEPHRFGWVVEIDPMDPSSVPKKRTALGRMKHENAALTVDKGGHVVVYMGDDERGEYLYRFVSRDRVDPANPTANPKANRELLDAGTLYVAQFGGKKGEGRGTGRWIALDWGENGLTPENGFADPGEVLIFARAAADRVGATALDRPEWVAIHPENGQVFCTMTNNSDRGVKDNQPVDAVNPRPKNIYGHIVRWFPEGGDHRADRFGWDLYVMAGNPVVHGAGFGAGSGNVTPENMFNSPDGLGFDADGRLWILTDGNHSNEKAFAGMGNSQMLCADPSSGEIRRFLTGPIACEITGLTFSPDYTTVFVGIQHPGERAVSHFPGGGDSIPRSSVMMITRDDGGVIGA
uniref:Tat (Twin-arginine translocation) pathway signal sequence n=1 Tax=Candidatus Kentrum sp. FM TaxID=2126340 RepID=A0A450SX30_9GAMM|nr:MAG: hypothetical protein BECKFM1743C_GA0114222_102305 [Candidatus Kentron sp. FM]VFJ59529.1 MAG: hypothetical protein BECKFM1743A_GA0114220_102395 [Candidatus Kentron sp. FM]VFK12115.1 MAG: hypothetical protein BECKFM1743B_GA0114221_102245 [Candidatus Kentron sp. FM]